MSWTTILDVSPNRKVMGRNRELWLKECSQKKIQD
jgi:hypothetical protein